MDGISTASLFHNQKATNMRQCTSTECPGAGSGGHVTENEARRLQVEFHPQRRQKLKIQYVSTTVPAALVPDDLPRLVSQ
jgi:hypothetical protein